MGILGRDAAKRALYERALESVISRPSSPVARWCEQGREFPKSGGILPEILKADRSSQQAKASGALLTNLGGRHLAFIGLWR